MLLLDNVVSRSWQNASSRLSLLYVLKTLRNETFIYLYFPAPGVHQQIFRRPLDGFRLRLLPRCRDTDVETFQQQVRKKSANFFFFCSKSSKTFFGEFLKNLFQPQRGSGRGRWRDDQRHEPGRLQRRRPQQQQPTVQPTEEQHAQTAGGHVVR